MKMRYPFLLLIFLGQFCYGQKCDALFNRFKNDIQIEEARYHRIKWDDETKESYYSLLIHCPIENLVTYVDDSIPTIRCLIFVGLAQKNADEQLLSEILARHKNDTANYIDAPTDVVMTWTVNHFMKTILDSKVDQRISNAAGDYAFRLETVKSKFQNRGVLLPGEYHGIIPKDSLLKMDSLFCSWKDYKVVSFALSKDNITIYTQQNYFNEQIKVLLRSTCSGDVIYIDEIVVEDLEKRRHKLPYIRLEIK